MCSQFKTNSVTLEISGIKIKEQACTRCTPRAHNSLDFFSLTSGHRNLLTLFIYVYMKYGIWCLERSFRKSVSVGAILKFICDHKKNIYAHL